MYKEYLPAEEDQIQARESKQILARHVHKGQMLNLQVIAEEKQDMIELPSGVIEVLMDVLGVIASGKSVTIIPQDAELTTAQAAEILNVSRPYVVKLLEEGVIPHRKVGTHRRVQMEDVMDYKLAMMQKKAVALEELITLSQELGLYD